MRLLSRTLIASTTALALSPNVANAQAIDYSALQEAFGEPVTTSVTGKPQRASEVPASTTIISREDIARSPARDIPGLLKSSVGIDVNRWTAGQTDIAVRGGVQTYNARLLVLVDGRQVYLDHYGLTNWNLLGVQLGEIEQIEIVRGPASALFGFNAASGVINIITRQVSDATYGSISAEGGTKDYSRIAATLAMPIVKGVGARVTAGRLREDERRLPDAYLQPPVLPVKADQISAEVRGSFGANEIVINGGHATNSQLEFLPVQLLSMQGYNTDNAGIQYKRDTPWGGISLGSYINWLDVEFGLGDQFASLTIYNRNIVNQGSAIVRIAGGSTLRLGAEYRRNQLRSLGQFYRTVLYDAGAINGILDYKLSDTITTTLAGRVDKIWLGQKGSAAAPGLSTPEAFDRDFTRASFNAAVLWRLSDNDFLRVNGGLGHQLPPLAFYGLQLPVQIANSPFAAWITGDPGLSPIAVWSGEAAYTREIGNAKLGVAGFYMRTDSAFGLPAEGTKPQIKFTPRPTLLFPVLSLGHYDSYGIELSASSRFGAISWNANYALTKMRQDIALPRPYPHGVSPRDSSPTYKLNLTGAYTAGRLTLSATGRLTSSTRQFVYLKPGILTLSKVDAAFGIDARAGYRLSPKFEIYAEGDNLGDASGVSGSAISSDRRIRGGVGVSL